MISYDEVVAKRAEVAEEIERLQAGLERFEDEYAGQVCAFKVGDRVTWIHGSGGVRRGVVVGVKTSDDTFRLSVQFLKPNDELGAVQPFFLNKMKDLRLL